MTTEELTAKLKHMYEHAPVGESTTMIHLFGVLYAGELACHSMTSLRKIAMRATGKESYAQEIRKCIKLAEYVELKANYREKF